MPNTMFLVEDEPPVSPVLEGTLGEMGYDVIAVITDIKLDNDPNGWHAGHQARELEPALPVLHMSADSAEDWPRMAVPAHRGFPAHGGVSNAKIFLQRRYWRRDHIRS